MANNYLEIMKLVNQGNKMGLSNTITRDNGIPLDLSSVQQSYEAAVIYAATKSIAYVGQPISVGDKLYIISETAAAEKFTAADGTEYDNYLVEVGKETNLSDYYTKSEVDAKVEGIVVPTKVSELENDAGYLTAHQDISGKADKATTLEGYGITDAYTKTEVDGAISTAVQGILGEDISEAYDTLKEIQDILEGTDGETIDGLIETVAANKQAIETLNGTGAGSVDKKIADAIAPLATTAALNEVSTIASNAATKVDTLEDKIDEIIADGGEPNTIEYIHVNGVNVAPVEKVVDITVPTQVEDLTDGADLKTLAQKGVDDAATAKSAADAAAAQAETNKTDIAGHLARIGALETAKAGHETRIANLEGLVGKEAYTDEQGVTHEASGLVKATLDNAANIGTINGTIAALDAAYKKKDEELVALIQGNTDKFAGYYTKTEADAAVKAVTGEVAADTTLVAMIGAKADQSTTYTKTEVDNLLANLDQTEINEAIEANTNAIAALIGEVEGDEAKSVRNIAKEEVAAIVGAAPETLNTLEEVAQWIENDETGAAAMANDIAALKTKVDTGDQKVSEYVAAQIATIPTYELPVATAEVLGGIKSAADIVDGETTKATANAVYVDAAGVGSVKAVSTDILVQGTETLILNGGSANA